jgi:DNA (cytosine-5)-methyltransferase 1
MGNAALRVGSLFSGVGGFDIGFETAGFEVLWQVEIDKDATSVLERHYPNVRRYRDVCEVDPLELEPVDVVTFGSPCQDLSVAGKRAGFEGERSGLFHEAVRIIKGLRPTPAFCVWENVPGALSSDGGRDFGAALDALADAGALDIAWRVLDAQWFGVPQRRRRIFLVADFGAERAASVLFESESGGRDLETCGEAGKRATGDIEDGTGSVSFFTENYSATIRADVAPTVSAEHGLSPLQNAGGLMVMTGGVKGENGQVVARATNCQQGIGDPTAQTFITETVRSHPRPGSNSVGNSVAFQESQSGMRDGETFATLDSNYGSRRHNGVAVAFSENIRAEVRETPYVNALAGGGGKPGQGYPAVRVPVAFHEDQRTGAVYENDHTHALSANGGGKPGQGYQAVRSGMAVRRLTPTECCRLMGWPDDHVRYRADGSLIPDGAQYRLIGNGVVAPVAAWIARRLRRVMEQTS